MGVFSAAVDSIPGTHGTEDMRQKETERERERERENRKKSHTQIDR